MPRNKAELERLLELEYSYSQTAIDKFDEYRARLKGWMITSAAGIAAVAFSAHDSLLFWAGALTVVFFGIAEMAYIDIQEDAITRNCELGDLLDSLSRGQVGPEHEAYHFGLGKVFGGGRMLKPKKILAWSQYRTFNPVLYGGIFILMISAAIIGLAHVR